MIQKYIEDTVADLAVKGKIQMGSKIQISHDPKKNAAQEVPVKVKITHQKIII
jgi:hypothetical protein